MHLEQLASLAVANMCPSAGQESLKSSQGHLIWSHANDFTNFLLRLWRQLSG